MENKPHNPVFCAIDSADPERAEALAGQLVGSVGGIKLGLEFFGAFGPAGFRHMARAGVPLFLDLKFHDIPNTVAAAVRAVLPLAPAMLSVHTAGGAAMLRAARQAIDSAALAPAPLLLGVTVLTSLGDDDLAALGCSDTTADQVLRLAAMAVDCGLDGIVCSPHEIAPLRQRFGDRLKLVVPGIRPSGAGSDDQKRVMTPPAAMAAGADYLVVGRPITGAPDPAAAARQIVASLKT